MARAAATSIENNFSKGLITEATAMNYPEDSVVATDNCIFSKTGEVIRRYGIDYEHPVSIDTFNDLGVYGDAVEPSSLYDNLVVSEYEWSTVANSGSISFVVIQLGNVIHFYETSDTNNIAGRRKEFYIDLTDYQVPTFTGDEGQFVGQIQANFASGFGYLFITHPYCDPLYVVYDTVTDDITVEPITITVRDFERLVDNLAVDERPSSLTDEHKYNLYNQGWYASAKNKGSTTSNVITYWDAQRTDFPSNADIWWSFKNSSELIDADLFDTQALGNTPAPNGHFTYNAFDVDRNTALSTTDLPDISTDNRPSVTAFFSGRVWYAGVQETQYATKIYFSKIIEGVSDFGVCYQLADPTSEVNNELLPSDGGVINIPDIHTVLKLVPVGQSLLVFASNGVWSITGPSGVFTANDYSVTKISNLGLTAVNSVVIAEGIPIWWNTAGIYTLVQDPTSGRETVQNISETTIQTLVNSIPDGNLNYVKGAYNSIDKNVHFLYRSTPTTTVVDSYHYDKLLILNVPSQSFSLSTISDGVPKVSGLVFTIFSSEDEYINVKGASLVKYITIGDIGPNGERAITFSQFNNAESYDWVTYDGVGVDAESYFISGYRIRGELLRKFQSNYIVVMMRTEDDASAFVQGVWDYANDEAGGRFTTRQQVYRSDGTRDYSRAKVKMRGNGYSLQLKFSSEPGKPFSILGWTTSDTGNNVP